MRSNKSTLGASVSKYDVIAKAFNVLDVATPITHYAKPKEHLQHIWERVDDEWFIVVRDERKIHGYLAVDDDAFNNPITGDAQSNASQITPDITVPGTMPILDLVPLFESNYFYFVLTSNNITHVVSFNDLDSLPMKLCLFSLFMELEAAMLQLFILKGPKTDVYLNLLPEDRIAKAKDLCGKKYPKFDGKVDPAKLILCTTLIDKITMLSKSDVYKILNFPSKNKLHSFFHLVEKTRNQIAHGDSILSMFEEPGELNNLIVELKRILAIIQTA